MCKGNEAQACFRRTAYQAWKESCKRLTSFLEMCSASPCGAVTSLYVCERPGLRNTGCCLIKVSATDSCMHVGTSPCTAGSSDRDAGAPQLARERALGMLCCAVEKAQRGGHQYLSGTLHNVAKALAHAQLQPGAPEALLAAGYGSSRVPRAAYLPADRCFCI